MDQMSVWIIGFVVIGVIWLMGSASSVGKLVREAIKNKSPEPILEEGEKLEGRKQSFFYQRAIELLWNGYHRELAAHVIRAFAAAQPGEKLCQYWMKQLLELENEIAMETLGETFIQDHYMPEIAQTCGVAG